MRGQAPLLHAPIIALMFYQYYRLIVKGFRISYRGWIVDVVMGRLCRAHIQNLVDSELVGGRYADT